MIITVVGSSPGGPITELLRAMHIKDPLPSFKKSRVVFPVGVSPISPHRSNHMHQRLNKFPTLLSP